MSESSETRPKSIRFQRSDGSWEEYEITLCRSGRPLGNGLWAHRLHGPLANFQNLPREPDFPNRAGQRSDEFRSDASKRKWETSYTKRVVDDLRLRVRPFLVAPENREAVNRAIDLLIDYHATQHVVYEQRDKARQQAKDWRGAYMSLRGRLSGILK